MIQSFLRRHVFEPIYYTIVNSPQLSYYKRLKASQYLPLNSLLEKQWQRLVDILNFTYDNNSYYAAKWDAAGINVKNILNPDDFRKIPILTKKEIRQNMSSMISKGFDIKKLHQFKTGGSTGKALELYITDDCSQIRNAAGRRSDSWSGWRPGEPVGAVWGNPPKNIPLKYKFKSWLLNPTIFLDTMCLTEESIKQFEKEWCAVKPTLLFGHAHSLYIVAKMVKEYSCNRIRPKAIISSSMMLLPHERKTIEDVFGVKVSDRYGCEEVSLIASECELHDGMHLNIEHLYIEFLKENGEPAVAGEPGRIIVTDLFNRAMPFIRYQIEDMGAYLDKQCACGRGLPLMSSVSGRVADFLIKPDGSKVAGVSLIENTLTKIKGIDQMQIVQHTIDRITIFIVAGAEYCEATKQELSDYFISVFSEKTDVVIELTSEIKPEKNGKYRFSICSIPQAQNS
jgi:phenylacetate-CoA ligase